MSDGYQPEIEKARRLAAEGHAVRAFESLAELARSAPDDVGLLLALAAVARAAGLLDEAEAAYRAVLDRQPNAVEAAVGVANVLVVKGQAAPAMQILTRILAIAPDLAPAAMALGAAQLTAGDAEAALAIFDRLVERHPSLAQAHANRAEALARLGRHDGSLAALDTAHRLAPTDSRIGLNRAFALLVAGRLDEGFAAYEARLAPDLAGAPVRENLPLPRWSAGVQADGALPEGPLLVVSEQGLGDEIRFGSAAWQLARNGTAIVMEVEPRLVGLFRRSLPNAEIVAYERRRSGIKPIFRYDWVANLRPTPAAWIEIGSLVRRCWPDRTRPIAQDGYLRPDAKRIAALRRRLGSSTPTVGIVWGSSAQDVTRSRFYPPLDAWGPVLALPGVRFVDLQYVDSAADRAMFRERFGVDVQAVDDIDKRDDLDGAAALAAAVDVVVGVSSSVTALAGAVGTPTIEVLGERTWLPLVRGHDAWLGPIRRVEAAHPGAWDEAMRRATAMLSELVDSR